MPQHNATSTSPKRSPTQLSWRPTQTADAARELAESAARRAPSSQPRWQPQRTASTSSLDISRTTLRTTRASSRSHARAFPPPTGHDKTSIVTFQRANRPGSLVNILQEFSARNIDLTHLQSRPTKRELGDYCFVIELEGHVADERVADCLKNVQAKQAQVRFLGSTLPEESTPATRVPRRTPPGMKLSAGSPSYAPASGSRRPTSAAPSGGGSRRLRASARPLRGCRSRARPGGRRRR